jgi:hypothetical protein
VHVGKSIRTTLNGNTTPSMIQNMNMVIVIMGLTHTMNMVFPNKKLIKMSTTT